MVNNCQTGHNIEILIAKVYSMTAEVHCEKLCNQNLKKVSQTNTNIKYKHFHSRQLIQLYNSVS